jgi:release factor glutamine methyltransferase
MIYEPAEDSFLMAEVLGKYCLGRRVLDMGAGSGILGEKAIELGAKEVLFVDIDSDSVEEIKKRGLNAVRSDLFASVKGKFDLIVFNPPYLPLDSLEDSESSRATAGGVRGDEVIVRFLREVGDFLASDGIILLLVSSLTPLGRIEEVLRREGFTRKVVASEKLFMEKLEVWEIKRKT